MLDEQTDGVVGQHIAEQIEGSRIAFRDGRRPVASGHLFEAILMARRAASRDVRAKELAKLGALCLDARFEDLALIALVGAIGELEATGKLEEAEAQMLEVANLFGLLGNVDDMKFWNHRALDTSMAHGHHAHAASASTNLAGIAAQNGELERAEQLATASLTYLRREPLPRTEAITRSLLVRIGAQLERPAEEAFAIARPLFGTLSNVDVSDELRAEVTAALDSIAGRHLAAHPELDAATWKRQQLPELWGDSA